MQLDLTNEEAQFLFRACNFILADTAAKVDNPIPDSEKSRVRMINSIKEKIKAEALNNGIDITTDI